MTIRGGRNNLQDTTKWLDMLEKEVYMGKAEHEREVFFAFAADAGLDLDEQSVRSAEPPEPDIFCCIGEEARYFELTRVSDQRLANAVGGTLAAVRRGAESAASDVVSFSDKEAVKSAIKKKAEKEHKTGSVRFDLLLYCDGLFHPQVNVDFVRDVLRQLEEKYGERWHSVWLYDVVEKRIVWPESNEFS